MAMSCNIRRLEKKLYRKLLKTQIDIETLLQEYIGNAHYVSTEPHEPFAPAMWVGSFAGSSREFVNTCPVDSPLTWLVYSMALVKGFSHYILEKFPIALKIFE